MRTKFTLAVLLAGATILVIVAVASAQTSLTDQEELGKYLFFDENLSLKNNQSCAVCHGPNVGWTGPDQAINAAGAVYEGSIPGAFGDRKPPAAAYAGDSPVLYDWVSRSAPLISAWRPPQERWSVQCGVMEP